MRVTVSTLVPVAADLGLARGGRQHMIKAHDRIMMPPSTTSVAAATY
jgi:hypothetical protein